MGTGWVRGGYTGYYPATWKAEADTSEAGPGSPARAGVGGYLLQRPLPPHARPAGPVGPLALPMLLSSPDTPLLANKGEIPLILL